MLATILSTLLLPFAAETPSEIVERLDALLGHCHAQGVFNGVALARRDGETIYERAFGLADRRDGRPLDVDTSFYLASVSKQFTAVGVLLLVDDGKLSCDDELTTFFPELAFAQGVTVHHLLTHTSGVPDHYELLGAVPAGLTNARVLETLVEHGALEFPPGSRHAYSNGGYVLLSMIVAKVADQDFASFMTKRVFAPLGMTSTLVFDESRPVIDNRAVGFAADGSLDDYTLFTTGAGGMYSTAGDLALWDSGLRAGDLLEPQTLERAYTPVRLADGSKAPYGYGWQLAQTPDGRVAHHGGGMAGFRTSIVRNLDNGNTLILLTNHGGDALLGAITQAAGAILRGEEPPLPAIPVAIPLRRRIATDGVAAGLAWYDTLRADLAATYDLGEEQLNGLGYEFLQAGRIDAAVSVFAKNVQVFPEAFNAYDSLAEAQLAAGDRAASIANYERSLELNPANTNASEKLERLRAEAR